MNVTQATVTSRSFLTECWVFEDKRYTNANGSPLPYISLEYEGILEDNGIPYRASNRSGTEVWEFWDPECYEEEELTLPLYAKVFDKYQYLNKSYTGMVPTAETVQRAWKIEEEVHRKFSQYRRHLEEVERYEKTKRELDGNLCGMYFTWGDDKMYRQSADIEMNGDHFKILPLYDARGNFLNYVAAFNMDKIVPGGYVTLKVLRHLEGWVKGTHGTNIRTWAAEIGVKRINVVTH